MGALIRVVQRLRVPLLVKLQTGFVLIALLVAIGLFSAWLTFEHLSQNITRVRTSLAAEAESQNLVNDVNDVASSLSDMKYVVKSLASGSSEYGGGMDANDDMFGIHQKRLEGDRQRASTEVDNLQTALTHLDNPPKDVVQMLPSVTMPLKGVIPLPGSNFSVLIDNDVADIAQQIDDFAKAAPTMSASNSALQVAKLTDRLTELSNQLTAFNNSFGFLNNTLHNLSKAAEDEANESRKSSQSALLVGGALVIFFALSFGFLISLPITQPIDRLRRRLTELSDGDLRGRLDSFSGDQLGVLAQTFNQSVHNLGSAIDQVQGQSLRINSASTEIAAASRQQANLANEQASAVAQATVTIEELSHTAQQIAEAASLVANAADQALSNAGEGQETVKESIAGINIIKLRVQDIAAKILALSERAQRVNKIIELISSIAQETHLLALNAAIESAGAGEQGRRFAEVAKKVKQLAERTRSALREVQVALGEIKEATNASVMATEQGLKEAERGVMLAHRSGDANESIIQMVERTVQLASAISLATQQQRSASEQVVASMRQLALIIREGAASAQQSSELAIALDQVSLDLRQVAARFRLPQAEPQDMNTPDILSLADQNEPANTDPFMLGVGSADSGGTFMSGGYPMISSPSGNT